MLLRIHVAVRSMHAERAVEILESQRISVIGTSAASVPGRVVLVVLRESHLSRSAAFAEESAHVLTVLGQSNISVELVATEVATASHPPTERWLVLRPVSDLGPALQSVDRFLLGSTSGAGKVRAARLRAHMAHRLYGHRARVAAGDESKALKRAQALYPGARVVRAAASVTPSVDGDILGGRMEGFDLVAFPVVLGCAFLLGLYGAYRPTTAWIAGAVAAVAVLGASLLRGGWRRRILRLLRSVAYCVIGISVALLLNRVVADPDRATGQFVLAVLILLGGVGVLVEWRSRRVGQTLPWALPVALSLTGGLVLALGYVSHWGYAVELGLPHGALGGDTAVYAVAGLLPSAMGVGLLVGVVALYGLIRWLIGSQASSGVLIAITALLGVSLALIFALDQAGRGAADLREAVEARSVEELPYFYLVEPELVCARLMSPDAAVQGGPLEADGQPWVLLGEFNGRYVLWRSPDDYRRVSTEALSVWPDPSGGKCRSQPE